jgi:hypothetical protein
LRSRGWVCRLRMVANYYEHIVRTPQALETIRHYIRENPQRWEQDAENPDGRPDIREKAFWDRFRHGAEPTRQGAGHGARHLP